MARKHLSAPTLLISATVLLSAMICQAEPRGAPRVDAEITAISVSPDNTRVALWLKRRVKTSAGSSDPSYAYSVGCFDPNARKILGIHAVQGCDPLLKWSPDSRWLAASTHEKSLLLVDRDGRQRTLSLPGDLRGEAWRADAAGIAYCIWGDKTGIYEQAVDPRTPGKRCGVNRLVVGLFNVQGKMCYGYLYPSGEPGRAREVRAARLGEAHPFLRIPLPPALNEHDCYWLDVSPDGRFFQFASVVAAGVWPTTIGYLVRGRSRSGSAMPCWWSSPGAWPSQASARTQTPTRCSSTTVRPDSRPV